MFDKFSDSGWKFVNALASARQLREKEIIDIHEEAAENNGISDNATDKEMKEEEE